MSTPSHQELFDRALNGLRKQGAYGFDKASGGCSYYDEKTGNRCAIGLLVPEELAKSMQEYGIGTISDWCNPSQHGTYNKKFHDILDQKIGITENIRFLIRLQNVHDACASANKPISLFEDEMSRLAVAFGLTFTPAPSSTTT